MVQRIETLVGPMKSGKSDELIRRMEREQIARNEIIVFKPKVDTRTENLISTRNGKHTLPAFPVENSQQLYQYFQEIHQQFKDHRPHARITVGIDEAQFFDEDLPGVLWSITHDYDCRVVVSGLARDFRGVPFGPMPTILAMSQEIQTFAALCTYIVDQETQEQCNQDATETYRTIDGDAADFHDPVVLIGDGVTVKEDHTEGYEAFCQKHYKIKNAPPAREYPYNKKEEE